MLRNLWGCSVANVYVTGGTGYMGRNLIPLLRERGHSVRCVVRPGSENKLPRGCDVHVADALNGESYAAHVSGCDTFLHLIGEPSPNPKKAERFKAVDLQSCNTAVAVARRAGIRHFIYVSVAHPAPIMQAYIDVRVQCEDMIRAAGLNATILRPWYVLGPGHRWPYALKPLYWIARQLPSLHEDAERLGLVTLEQMMRSLIWAVQSPARGVRVMEVSVIRIGRAYEEVAFVAKAS
jgi:uncharacterized protein YbjT (DUF2867 family)